MRARRLPRRYREVVASRHPTVCRARMRLSLMRAARKRSTFNPRASVRYDTRMRLAFQLAVLIISLVPSIYCQQPPASRQQPAEPPKPHLRPSDIAPAIPTRFDMLRGAYGPYRANNDLLYY